MALHELPHGPPSASGGLRDMTTSRTAPEIAGFSYVEDDAAYRIRCDSCQQTAGTLARSEDYACGWLDHWAFDHLESCEVMGRPAPVPCADPSCNTPAKEWGLCPVHWRVYKEWLAERGIA